MSAATLADRLSVSTGVLAAYERGTLSLRGERLIEIATRLGVPPSCLFHDIALAPNLTLDLDEGAECAESADLAASDALMISNIVANIRDRAIRLAVIELVIKASAAAPASPPSRAAQ